MDLIVALVLTNKSPIEENTSTDTSIALAFQKWRACKHAKVIIIL